VTRFRPFPGRVRAVRASSSPVAGDVLYDGLTPTIYAHPTAAQGNGSGSSEANAMLLTDALASGSSIVGLLPGVASKSWSGSDARWDPIYEFSAGGTAGSPKILVGKYNPLTYYADTSKRSELRNASVGAQGNANNKAILGANGKDYCEFRNLFFDEQYSMPGSSRGGCLSHSSDNNRWRNIVWARTQLSDASDNYNCFYFEDSHDLTLENFYVYAGSTITTGHHNLAAVQTYSCLRFAIRYYTFDSIQHGIYVKGAATADGNSGEIYGGKSKNLLWSQVHVGVVHTTESPENTVVAHHCLSIRDAQITGGEIAGGFRFEPSGDGGGGANNRNRTAHHWTIVDPGGISTQRGIEHASTPPVGDVVRDSVIKISGASKYVMTVDSASLGGFTSNYNQYHNDSGNVRFALAGATKTSLGTWQTDSGKDANSNAGDPAFDNAGADDYRRTASGDTGSSTGGKRGCYDDSGTQIGDGVH